MKQALEARFLLAVFRMIKLDAFYRRFPALPFPIGIV